MRRTPTHGARAAPECIVRRGGGALERTGTEGRVIRIEPLARAHVDGLWEASREQRVWRWLPVVQPQTCDELAAWLDDALTRAAEAAEIPFATIWQDSGEVAGSTRFLALRPEHGSVEIGWAWLRPEAWGRGANAKAKLLQLEHAFEHWGCRRVELKTEALNVPARQSMEALGAVFEGVHRKHMLVRAAENRDTASTASSTTSGPGCASILSAV